MIPVVIKTLESANIHLDDIIQDAEKHEKILETRSMRLISKIELLESKVAAMNDRVLHLNENIEEITNVKHMLMLPSEMEEEVIEEEIAEVEEEITDVRSTVVADITDDEFDELADEIKNDLNGGATK